MDLALEEQKKNKKKVVWATLEALVVANSEREIDGLCIGEPNVDDADVDDADVDDVDDVDDDGGEEGEGGEEGHAQRKI